MVSEVLALLAKGDPSGGGAGGVVLAVGVVLFIYWYITSSHTDKGKHKGRKK